jgi:hypothetical protein
MAMPRWEQLPPSQVTAQDPQVRKAKRSTAPGEARAKLIAALTLHHGYASNGCLNPTPIGVRALAEKADVSKDSAFCFFKKEFDGHLKYRAACADTSLLLAALKMLNGEYAPHCLYGRTPSGEGRNDEE